MGVGKNISTFLFFMFFDTFRNIFIKPRTGPFDKTKEYVGRKMTGKTAMLLFFYFIFKNIWQQNHGILAQNDATARPMDWTDSQAS
jgi:hypothetical protein